MLGNSIWDWFLEQEHRRNPAIFFLEWVSIFTPACLFWTVVFSRLQASQPSLAEVGIVSAVYGSVVVYLRLLGETGCHKCHSPLPLQVEEVSRRHVRDEERTLEVERGGEAWGRHFLDLYVRIYEVAIIRLRCRRCQAVWDETEISPSSGYRRVRTLDLSK
jgi:hypothetical protein